MSKSFKSKTLEEKLETIHRQLSSIMKMQGVKPKVKEKVFDEAAFTDRQMNRKPKTV